MKRKVKTTEKAERKSRDTYYVIVFRGDSPNATFDLIAYDEAGKMLRVEGTSKRNKIPNGDKVVTSSSLFLGQIQ